MKRFLIYFILFFFFFGCIDTEIKELDLSEMEIDVEMAKDKLIDSEQIGLIMDVRGITQENKVKVYECAVGYSRSLGEKNKTIITYGIDIEEDKIICLNDDLGETTIKECSNHIKENVDYSIYLIGKDEAETIFFEDHMKVSVPENNIVECKIN